MYQLKSRHFNQYSVQLSHPFHLFQLSLSRLFVSIVYIMYLLFNELIMNVWLLYFPDCIYFHFRIYMHRLAMHRTFEHDMRLLLIKTRRGMLHMAPTGGHIIRSWRNDWTVYRMTVEEAKNNTRRYKKHYDKKFCFRCR